MKDIEVYRKELNDLIEKIRNLEQEKSQCTTRAIELQGIIKELKKEISDETSDN